MSKKNPVLGLEPRDQSDRQKQTMMEQVGIKFTGKVSF